MNLRFATIIHGDEEQWPGNTASVIYLAGCPLNCKHCNAPSLIESKGFDEEPIEYFLNELSKSEAIVLTGGEPLMQGNALLKLIKQLKVPILIKTNGYYPETLNDCLPHIDEVVFGLKTGLNADAYKETTGFRGDAETLYSNLLRSLTFLEVNGSRVRKTFSLTITPNTTKETVRELTEYVSLYCDEFTLQSTINEPKPSKELLNELLMEAKKRVRRAVIK